MNKRLKFLITALVLLALFFAYVYFSPGSGGNEAIVPVGTGSAAVRNMPAEGAEILGMLANLRSIKLDASFFENELFKGLVDFSVELEPEEAGRPNPFAPLD